MLADFFDLIFPSFCLGQGDALVKGEYLLSTSTLAKLPYTNYHLKSDHPLKEKLYGRIPTEEVLAFLFYEKGGLGSKLIKEIKYNGHQDLAVYLGKSYGKILKESGKLNQFDAFVPVPLHKSKLTKRTFNQSLAFCEGLASESKIPIENNWLFRKTNHNSQTQKSREIRYSELIEDYFAVEIPSNIKHIALVDDVITTGATIEICANCLLKKGVEKISVIALADAK